MSRRFEPLLCHGIGIAGEVVLKYILCAGVHTRDACPYSSAPGIEVVVAEYTG